MTKCLISHGIYAVAPLAGAWIEMKHSIIGQKDRPSLHSRERGLKWLGVPVFIRAAGRSTRGSVD